MMTRNEIALAAAARTEKVAAGWYNRARMEDREGFTIGSNEESTTTRDARGEWHAARAMTNVLRETVLDEKNAAWDAVKLKGG